ncbi:MAG: Uma2 family endonuclease [Gemmataceae bacterium]
MRSAARVTTERSGAFTYEDFCSIVAGKQKGDLIDGVIYVASPDNTDAAQLFVWLIGLMNGYAARKRLGKILGSRVACRFDDREAPEPDILFVKASHLDRVKRGGVDGPPDLAIEIVSPDSVERDYGKKRKQYERHGIAEYWIIDEENRSVLVLHLDGRKKYREVKQPRGRVTSQELAGFWLKRSWLWQRPLPDPLDSLQLILKERQ